MSGVTGWRGTTQTRGKCPRCKRHIPGGRLPDGQVELRRHKIEGTHPGRPWCIGPDDPRPAVPVTRAADRIIP